MKLKDLERFPPWQWPDEALGIILGVLKDGTASEADRVLAAGMAGEIPDFDDEAAEALLEVVRDAGQPPAVRAKAAVAFGPAFEYTETAIEFEDPDAEAGLSDDTFEKAQETFRTLFEDKAQPKLVRRKILEASVRALQEWHEQAVREAWAGSDPDWRLTAAFAMRWVPGFEDEILEALGIGDPEILCEAVQAAGAGAIEEAWPVVSKLLSSKDTEKRLLLAAIEAAPFINRDGALERILPLTRHPDEDVSDAAEEQVFLAEETGMFDDEEEWDDEE